MRTQFKSKKKACFTQTMKTLSSFETLITIYQPARRNMTDSVNCANLQFLVGLRQYLLFTQFFEYHRGSKFTSHGIYIAHPSINMTTRCLSVEEIRIAMKEEVTFDHCALGHSSVDGLSDHHHHPAQLTA
jgi:hypothetical protein